MIKSPEISSWLCKNVAICFLLETHMMTKREDFNIDYFKCCNNPFSDVLAKKARGGVTCLIKLEYMQHVTKLNCDNPDNINTLMGLNFVDFGQIRENPQNFIPRNICFAVIREIKSPRNIWKKDLIHEICHFFQKTCCPQKHDKA